MTEVAEAKLSNDEKRLAFAQEKVNCFTEQLNESNPILTDIASAMTEEGECTEIMNHASRTGDEVEKAKWKERMESASQKKAEGNFRLLAVSSKYMNLMKNLREEYIASICTDPPQSLAPFGGLSISQD
jgi:hypothetical protein